MATKKVRLLVSFEGQWSGSPGDIVERDVAEADSIIAAGFAEEIDKPKRAATPRRKATSEARETATAED